MKLTLLSGTTTVLSQILAQLGAVDFYMGDRIIRLANSRLHITISLDHDRVEFDSTNFNRAPHKGFYDIYDTEQVTNLIDWVKTVMEA